MQHDSSSVLAMATNTLHNVLCITVNLFKNLRLRIAIVRRAWRQPNISKHTSALPPRLVSSCSVNQSVNLLGNKEPQATYKSQNTIYNNYSPRQCIQYIKTSCVGKAVYKL